MYDVLQHNLYILNIRNTSNAYFTVNSKSCNVICRSSAISVSRKSYNVSCRFREILNKAPDIIQSNQSNILKRKEPLSSIAASKRGSISGGSHNRRELQRSIKILVMIVISHIILSTPGNILYVLASYGLDRYERIENEGTSY